MITVTSSHHHHHHHFYEIKSTSKSSWLKPSDELAFRIWATPATSPCFYLFLVIWFLFHLFKIRATPATLPCFSFFKVILTKNNSIWNRWFKKNLLFRFCLFLFSNKHCLRNTNSLYQNWDVSFQCSWTLEDNIAISICFKES